MPSTTINWKDGTSGDFATGADWVGGVAPGSSGVAQVTGVGSERVTVDSTSILAALVIDDSNATVTVDDSLTIDGAVSLTGGDLDIDNGGVLDAVGGLSVTAAASIFTYGLASQTDTIEGSLSLAAGAQLNAGAHTLIEGAVSGAGSLGFDVGGAEIELQGSIAAGTNLYLTNGSSLVVDAGSTFSGDIEVAGSTTIDLTKATSFTPGGVNFETTTAQPATIDFKGVTAAAYYNGVMTLTETGGRQLSFLASISPYGALSPAGISTKSDGAGGLYVSPNLPPIISGTVAGQVTTSEAPLDPFAGATITDANAAATDTLTITLSGAGGSLTGTGLVDAGAGIYALIGSAPAITSELDGLSFTPTAGAAGTASTTTFALKDVSRTPGTASVGGEAPTVLTSFSSSLAGGFYPTGGVIVDASGDLFGVTEAGGVHGDGEVFELPNIGSGYGAPIVLAAFTGTSGAEPGATPTGPLLADASGDLFGVNSEGGNGDGNIFEIVKTSSGFNAPVVLANLQGPGLDPDGALIADPAGDLFGTMSSGGIGNDGVVFELAKTASGYGALTTIAEFDGADGAHPYGGLVADAAGDLFGVTQGGGSGSGGTVFELVKTSSGYASPATLATFTGANGLNPDGALLIDSAGDLIGTTAYGGATFNASQELNDNGDGEVFELTRTASGYSAPTVLVSFLGTGNYAGAHPAAGLYADASGTLYGTTSAGGDDDDGVLYELAKTSSGYNYDVLSSFDGADGADPTSALTADANGDLFGTTQTGGANSQDEVGTVFEHTALTYSSVADDSTTTVVDNDPAVPVRPTIAGTKAGQTTNAETPVEPFAGVTIGDLNSGATDVLTVTVSGAGGVLGGPGLISQGGGVYTLSGPATTITNELDGLSFTPNVGTPDSSSTSTLTLSDVSSA